MSNEPASVTFASNLNNPSNSGGGGPKKGSLYSLNKFPSTKKAELMKLEELQIMVERILHDNELLAQEIEIFTSYARHVNQPLDDQQDSLSDISSHSYETAPIVTVAAATGTGPSGSDPNQKQPQQQQTGQPGSQQTMLANPSSQAAKQAKKRREHLRKKAGPAIDQTASLRVEDKLEIVQRELDEIKRAMKEEDQQIASTEEQIRVELFFLFYIHTLIIAHICGHNSIRLFL